MQSKHTINVLIADDHEIYLDGLSRHLSANEIYQVVGKAMNGEELVYKAAQLHPQIVLTDLRMPLLDGPAAIKQILASYPDIKCIVLTSYENELSIIDALESGAKGYMTKNMPKKDLFTALDQVSRGYPYFCLTTSSKMVRLIGRSSFNPYADFKKIHFSETERKIIQLICMEKDNREIASTLFLSVRTVENNRSRILRKINAKTTAGVAIYAIKHGLFLLKE
jgi:DNA-binding NarL/FixJ family response regulator